MNKLNYTRRPAEILEHRRGETGKRAERLRWLGLTGGSFGSGDGRLKYGLSLKADEVRWHVTAANLADLIEAKAK